MFRLVPEIEIRGTLRYSDTGEIASGVPLVLSAQEVRFFGDFQTIVDDSGRFHFEGLAPVPYVITLTDSFDRRE